MLHAILTFLSQLPVWFTSTFSAILGAVAGIFSGFIGKWVVDDFGRRRAMRRVLYRDLAQMFFAVEMTMDAEPSAIGVLPADPLTWRQGELRKFLFFHGEQYCLGNPEIYIQLPERFAGMTLYRLFHGILDDPAEAVPFNARSVTRTFAHYVHIGVLRRKYFQRFLRRDQVKSLLCKVDEIRTQNEEALKRIYDDAKAKGSIDNSTAQ
jgi:hypothetical protein